jgi:hypothetical protein
MISWKRLFPNLRINLILSAARLLKKLKKQIQMKRIGITNNPQFPIEEWSKQTIYLEDLFKTPSNLSTFEIEFARRIMDSFQLEMDDNENLIELISKPSDFMSFLVHIKRILDLYNKNVSIK